MYDNLPVSGLFDRDVEEKVARSKNVNGWARGPVFICEQAAEEPVDVPAWLTGLDLYPKPAGVDEHVARIHRKAAELWAEVEALKERYE